MAKKFYCYVDETGLDTAGRLFIVCILLVSEERDILVDLCERIEKLTGKNRVKWIKTRHERRASYIRELLQQPALKGKLRYCMFRKASDYVSLTLKTIARVLSQETRSDDYKVTVLVDGLPPNACSKYTRYLRSIGIRIKKVRGVRREENDALTRLVDAVCGLVRAADENKDPFTGLLREGLERGVFADFSDEKEKPPFFRG